MVRWPVRDTICIECRTALPAGVPCPAGPHRVEKLRDAGGREALLTEVWGPKSMRLRLREAMKVGAAGGTGVSVLDGCSGCDLLDLGSGEFWAVLAVAVVVIAVLWFALKLVRDLILRRRHRLHANGARRKGPQLGPATGRVGTIISRDVARAPIGDRSCVAYALVVQERSTVMLRDAGSVGFEILLDTGEHVRVPAGTCVIDMTGATRATDLEAYLAELDPLRGSSDDLEPFPHDRAFARMLVPGDRVEVLGRLVPIADGTAGGGYREAAHTVLVPDTIPRLRLADETRAAGR